MMMLRTGMLLQDRYEILDQIGTGGMSEVYRARCHKLNRLVAIKVLKEEFSQDTNFVSKFKMEAQSAAGLSHPNIVSVYDVVDEGDLHYIVMEVIEGITLKSYIMKKGRLGIKESIGIAMQVAQGIGAAHDQHIVHRDIKPQNMIISRDGKVKVADFGIARAVSSQTIGSTAVGSVHYISPEQAKGGYSDARSDIYSLGITMYEMVTGELPFDGENTVTIALAHLDKPIVPPSQLNPEVTPSLERIILKCTQKKPERRYSDAYELIADLRRALLDPNDDFLKQEPETDMASPTVVIGGDDLNLIQDGAARENGAEDGPEASADLSGKPESKKRKKDKKGRKKDLPEDVNPQIERILTTVGIAAAFIIMIVVAVMLAKLGGVFNRGSGSTGTNGSAEAVESTDAGASQSIVPDLAGMTEEEARTALEKLSLVAVFEYQQSDDALTGLVIGQSVAPDTAVTRQSEVTVTVGEGSGKLNLTRLGLESMTVSEAQALLTEQNLTVTVQKESSDKAAADMVLRYEPEMAAPGETVTLYVSSGPAVPLTKVPDIVHNTPEQARMKLEAALLTVGTVTEERSETVPKGTIISQSLPADSDAPRGTAVGYVVSTGKETKYVAVVNDDYSLKELFGPGSGDTQLRVEIVMIQEVNGRTVEKVVLEPRVMGGDITIPVHYELEGADGVLTGELQIRDLTKNRVLKTYPLEFLEVNK